jgi:ribosome-associated protein YbcJ (S4-like RNA binding protein)
MTTAAFDFISSAETAVTNNRQQEARKIKKTKDNRTIDTTESLLPVCVRDLQ